MEFRQAVADWYDRRFGVTLDAATEVASLIGSKEGVANMAVAYVDPGDVVLVPTPAYPVYAIGTRFNGGDVHFLPLTRDNGFLPDLASIPADVLERAKMLWINYPNNPTGAVCDLSFFEEAVEFAHRHNIVLCHDAAYTELGFDDYRAPSILEVDGAREVAIEFHSLSKTFNMTGWRIGMAVGCAELVGTLAQVKSNVDSGVFQPVQEAAILALEHAEEFLGPNPRGVPGTARYRGRTASTAPASSSPAPRATFYVWLPVPGGWTSTDFTARLLDEAGIVTTPGNGFGDPGEGFIRMTLCSRPSGSRRPWSGSSRSACSGSVRHRAYIGVGSNQGDKEGNCCRAVREIGGMPQTRLRQVSSWFATEPWGAASAEWYVTEPWRSTRAWNRKHSCGTARPSKRGWAAGPARCAGRTGSLIWTSSFSMIWFWKNPG